MIDRAKAPTPKLFRILRTLGLVSVAVGSTLITAPVSLPLFLTTAAGYLITAGGVMAAVSQITTLDSRDASQ